MTICKKMHGHIGSIAKKLISLTDIFAPHATALIDLGLRLWIGLTFWKSGILKVESWDTTLMLFEYEHPVPFLSPGIASYLGTTNELLFSSMLFLGLGARISALGMLFMTAVIQFTYMQSNTHFIWMLVLLAIAIRGAGLYSIDYFIRQKYMGSLVKIGLFSRYIAIAVVSAIGAILLHDAAALVIDSVEPWLDGLLDCWGKFGTSPWYKL